MRTNTADATSGGIERVKELGETRERKGSRKAGIGGRWETKWKNGCAWMMAVLHQMQIHTSIERAHGLITAEPLRVTEQRLETRWEYGPHDRSLRFSSKKYDVIVHTSVCCHNLDCTTMETEESVLFASQSNEDHIHGHSFAAFNNYSRGSSGFSSGNEWLSTALQKKVHSRLLGHKLIDQKQAHECHRSEQFLKGLHVLFSDCLLHNLNHFSRDWSLLVNLVHHGITVSGVILCPGKLTDSGKQLLSMLRTFANLDTQQIRSLEKSKHLTFAALAEKASWYPGTPVAFEAFRSHVYSHCNVDSTGDTVYVLGRQGRRRFSEAGKHNLLSVLGQHNIPSVAYVEFEELSFCEQVQVMAKAEIFIAVHGQIIGNMPFLQPSAVFIELLFGYQNGNPVHLSYKGHGTGARTFGVSYAALSILQAVGNSSCNSRGDWMYSHSCESHVDLDAAKMVACIVKGFRHCNKSAIPYCSCADLHHCHPQMIMGKLCRP